MPRISKRYGVKRMSLLADLFDPMRNRGAMRCLTRPLYTWSLAGGTVPDRLLMLPPDPWPGDHMHGRALLGRVLDDAGGQVQLDPAIWSDRNVLSDSRRTKTVHGFEWLRDLRAGGGEQARKLGRQFMQEWLDANAAWQEGIWDYPVAARRVAAWLMGYDFFCASGDDAFLELFYTVLMRQIRHLDRANPDRLWGEDALAVIRARLFAGLCVEGGGARLGHSLEWLERWLQDEMGADGLHVSRSVARTVVLTRYLIDMRGALVRGGVSAPVTLQAAIDRAMHAVRFFRMPDGRLACFQGSREDDVLALDTLLRVSGVKIRKAPTRLENAGFESLVRERVTLIADGGYAVPHPHDLGSHAGPLAFEMSIGRDRLVVNCATHPSDPVWADHLRATAAHSTLTVDDRNAFEIREDGHIGRASTNVTARRDVVHGGIMLTMSHDGYAPLNGLVHTRRLLLSADGRMLEGEDGLASDVPLSKPTPFAIRFHLHPKVQASLIQDGQAALLRLPSGAGWRFSKKSGILSLEPSVYCGADAMPRKTRQLVVSDVTDGGTTMVGWSLTEE